MKTIEYRTCDKTDWGEGPWLTEPDKVQWQDPATGLPCLIVRNTEVTGALCGYVGVPEGHPFFQKGYDDVPVEVHGGLTFAAFCRDTEFADRGICHMVEPGEPDHVWWLGFDCSHAGDRSPRIDRLLRSLGSDRTWADYETYKDLAYVKAEVTALAQQLAARA